MKIKFILFILAIIFISGCMTTNTYHIDELQVFYTKDGKQIFMIEKEDIKIKTDKDIKKEIKTPIEQFLQLLDGENE